MISQFQKILNIRGITHQILADELGVTRQSVSSWCKRGTPPVKHLNRIAGMLDVTPGQLSGAEPFLTREEELSQKLLLESRDGWQIICSESRRNSSEEHGDVGAIELSDACLRRLTNRDDLHPEQFEIITMQGDSMEPTIRNNSFCLVDLRQNELSCDGIYLFRTIGGTFVKRVQRELDGGFTFISDNPKYQPRRVPLSTEEARTIVRGRVISIFNAIPC